MSLLVPPFAVVLLTHSGDKLNALDCYSHARLYVPHKSKLVDR